jgi:hypothetical protein
MMGLELQGIPSDSGTSFGFVPIRDIAETTARSQAWTQPLAGAPSCLICKGADGGFSAVEHPIPESIGNTTLVIPAGVVCDRCNCGPLSLLDQALAEFFPVKLRRTEVGVPSKKGVVPVTRLQENVRLEHRGGLGFIVGPEPKSWQEVGRSRVDPRIVFGDVKISGGRQMTTAYAHQLARATLKVGFECAWLEQRELLVEPRFDHVRELILGAPWRGYVFFGSDVDQRARDIDVWFDAKGDENGNIYFTTRSRIYGFTIATDTWRSAPPTDLAGLGWAHTFPD